MNRIVGIPIGRRDAIVATAAAFDTTMIMAIRGEDRAYFLEQTAHPPVWADR